MAKNPAASATVKLATNRNTQLAIETPMDRANAAQEVADFIKSGRKIVSAPAFDPSRVVMPQTGGRKTFDPATYALSDSFEPFGNAKTVSTVKQTLPKVKKAFASAGVPVEFAVTATDEPGYLAIYVKRG